MDEIRSIAGPIVQRYNDKVEEERAAVQAKVDAEQAEKRARAEAAAASARAMEEAEQKAKAGGEDKDTEMPDLEPAKPDEVQEAEEKK